MARNDLILGRYEPLGTAGEGGFGTVRVAWDPRIQRKVAIKTIRLTAIDAARAALPGARAVADAGTRTSADSANGAGSSQASSRRSSLNASPQSDMATQEASRWRGTQPWNEYLGDAFEVPPYPDDPQLPAFDAVYGPEEAGSSWEQDEAREAYETYEAQEAHEPEQLTYLAHMPGLDEARTAAMLVDPRIVTVYDFEVRERTAYLIMEYVEGITLTRLLQDYPDYITLDMLAALFDSVAGALTAAHEAGVLHLDIKPDNILISTQGQVKVTDFGLATLANAAGEGTAGGGTIGYMPPEQIRREQLDARADEWSLASVTYEMLTGSNPFRAGNLSEALAAIEDAELVLPSLCWQNIDDQIDDVIFYALDPDRDERYANIQDFAEEVDKFLGDSLRGAEQLQLVVTDAVGLDGEDAQEVFADGDPNRADEREMPKMGPDDAQRQGGVLGGLLGLFSTTGRRAHDGAGRNGAGKGFANAPGGAYSHQDAYSGSSYPDERGAHDPSHSTENGMVRVKTRQPRASADANAAPQRRSLTERFLELLPPSEELNDADDEQDGLESEQMGGTSRMPLASRVTPSMLGIAARVYAAIASGLLTALALVNIDVLVAAFGPGGMYVVAIASIAVGVLGAIRPHVGALASFSLAGISIVACGHPIVGALVLIATVAWWYTVGHVGAASANVALSMPLLGAIGGSSAVPFLAGETLSPSKAIATMLFASFVAVVFAGFGSMSLLDWNVLSHWDYGRANIAEAILRTLAQPSTWTTIAGWMAAATALALLRLRDSKPFALAGIALALSFTIAGGLAFSQPVPQLLVPTIFAAAALLILKLQRG